MNRKAAGGNLPLVPIDIKKEISVPCFKHNALTEVVRWGKRLKV